VIALSIWSTFGLIETCKKKRDDAAQSVKDMEKFVKDNKALLEDVKIAHEHGQKVKISLLKTKEDI
jgi:hypothetical protein